MPLGDKWIARNPGELQDRAARWVADILKENVWPVCWEAKKYRNPRSLPQNALLQVWARQFCDFMGFDSKEPEFVEATRITLQRHCYLETQKSFLIESTIDIITNQSRVQRRSTTKFDSGEMMFFLSWIQKSAAERGLILESEGEFKELYESQTQT